MTKTVNRSAPEAARARLAETHPADIPLLTFWRDLIPSDFDPLDDRKVVSLDFELSGIERGVKSLQQIERHAPLRGAAVLDIGAGNGGLCIACALSGAASTAGIEIEDTRIELARKWAECRGVQIDFRKGMAERLPFDDNSFDFVFLSSVIEHVENQDLTIREMARVLKSGGVFFLDGPNRLSPHWFMEDPHYRIPFVSVMPKNLGAWWVVKFRKVARDYTVGVFPVYSLLIRTLRHHGMQVLESQHNHYLLNLLANPNQVRSRSKRTLLIAGAMVGVNHVAIALLENILPSFTIIGRKT